MGFENTLLAGKRILVTGAGRGIGRGCTLALGRLGAEVVAADLSAPDLDSLAEESVGPVQTWEADVTSNEFTDRVRKLDRLDGLLNNAGTNRVGPMAEQSEADIDLIMQLNIRAVYRTTQAAITPLRRAGGGSIVSISSQMGHVGSPGRTLYCMSKHAIEGMTKALAVELATEGIRVNTVAPTFVMTPMTRPMFENPEFHAFVMDMIPTKKLAELEDVANACIFLLSDLSGSTTGACLKVDGGWTAQ
jgi:NAD(P)-dependent dehydrogenase (short-subunit alcohol dehydrogenase family)